MNRILSRFGLILILCATITCPAFGQVTDALLSWIPSTGSSSFGPFTAVPNQVGNMNMFQDGTCLLGPHVGASVVEEWLCGEGTNVVIQGKAGLVENSDPCIGNYPNGVFANGQVFVDLEIKNSELGFDDCLGNHFSSGGPHPWSCGTGSTFRGSIQLPALDGGLPTFAGILGVRSLSAQPGKEGGLYWFFLSPFAPRADESFGDWAGG